MSRPASSSLEADIAAALDWWREAGVDADYADEPHAWLDATKVAEVPVEQVRRPVAVAAPTRPEPKIGGTREGWPQELGAFRQWWLAEPTLDEGGLAPRIAPSGETGADLMVLVSMPEESDAETLLSGPQGKLLDGFLTAAGVASERVYRAAVLPRHTPVADWPELEAKGMGAVLAHHVLLVRPRRLIVFGRNILPLCGHDPAQVTQNLRSFNHEGGRVPALFTLGLERLRDKGQLRAKFWGSWLDWTESDAWREKDG
ncbi:hypothetical protein ACWPMX_06345 [Tsuneonella sp. HG094]